MISDDEPIQSTDDDLLGREPVAERIVEIVVNRPTSAPLVLALHGHWGSGKSSVLSLVRESLDGTDVICVEFQPWLFNNVEQLIRPFFATVYDALVKAGAPEKKLRKALERFGGLLTNASKVAGYEVDFASLSERSPAELRDEIGKVSAKLGRRIIVIIDDVDRLPIDELALLLKLVRLCGNLPYFTYLLAYDRQVVSSSLRTLYQGDSDFLDKIVQVEIPLPPVPPRMIADYVCKGLRELGASLGIDMERVVEEFQERDDETRHLLAPLSDNNDPRLLVRSLRDAKRFLNGLTCTLPLVRHEVDLVDFVHIELMRIFFPVLYDMIYAQRVSLATFDSRIEDDKRQKRQKRQEQHQKMAAEIGKLPHGEIALHILCELFPVFNASLYTPNQYYRPHPGWQLQMKAADPAHLEKYFQLRVPLDAVPRKDVREAIEIVNGAATPTEGRLSLVKKIMDYYERRHLSSFLDGIVLESGRILPTCLGTVIKAIADVAPVLAAKQIEEREMSIAVNATLRLAKKLPAATSTALIATLISAGNPSFAVGLIIGAEPREGLPSEVGVDFELIRSSFVARLRSELVVPVADIFAIYEYEWAYVLKFWQDPDEAARYLLALLGAKPERWIVLATIALEQRADQRTINLGTFRRVVALEELAEASRFVDASPYDGDGRNLLEAFVGELTLVPDLIAELHEVLKCATVLSSIIPGNTPSVSDWTVPVWERVRGRLQPLHVRAPWWPTLLRIFESFAASKQEVDALGSLSSAEVAVDPIAAAESLHRLGTSLAADIGSVVDSLRKVIGVQMPLPLPAG